MKIHDETIKEFGTILIRLGEAAVIGGVATLFVQDFPRWASLIALFGGAILPFVVCILSIGLIKENSSCRLQLHLPYL